MTAWKRAKSTACMPCVIERRTCAFWTNFGTVGFVNEFEEVQLRYDESEKCV